MSFIFFYVSLYFLIIHSTLMPTVSTVSSQSISVGNNHLEDGLDMKPALENKSSEGTKCF